MPVHYYCAPERRARTFPPCGVQLDSGRGIGSSQCVRYPQCAMPGDAGARKVFAFEAVTAAPRSRGATSSTCAIISRTQDYLPSSNNTTALCETQSSRPHTAPTLRNTAGDNETRLSQCLLRRAATNGIASYTTTTTQPTSSRLRTGSHTTPSLYGGTTSRPALHSPP